MSRAPTRVESSAVLQSQAVAQEERLVVSVRVGVVSEEAEEVFGDYEGVLVQDLY